MAVVASRVSVTTTATLLISNASTQAVDAASIAACLKNLTGTAAVFLGASGVTAATGFQWDTTDGPLSIDVEPGESLYGVVASTGQTVHVLKNGR